MLIRRHDGARILGGCDHRNTYQVVQADYYGPDLHRLAIHHDEWCPWFTARFDEEANR